MGRDILLITHFYPPSDMVAARRPAGLAKYLERLGHRATILTSRAWGRSDVAGEPATTVLRTADLMDSALNWRRGQLRAWTGSDGSIAADYDAGVSWPARVVVPDVAALTWAPFVLGAALRLVRGRRFDAVLTTSGPESLHLVGLALARRGLPWVADFRDGWGFESLRDWPTSPQWALDRWLERQVVNRADGVCAVTEPIAADMRERFGVDAWTITNGYDPEDPALADAPSFRPEPGVHRVLHSGRMGSSEHDPGPVVEALRLLDRDSPRLAATVRLSFAGPLTAGERELLTAPDVADRVELLGTLPRPEVLARQRAADSLLLLTSGKRLSVATGKLYEYLHAGRPVLVLGESTEAARIVGEAGAGIAVPVDDPAAIARALERIVAGEVAPTSAPEQYGYPAIAARLAELFEVAIERFGQRSSKE
ncbi:MAG: glycosyltransferase family 4 protein [Thermoleophilaceae bacterium]